MQRPYLTRTKVFCGLPYAVTPGSLSPTGKILTIRPTLRWNMVSSATKYYVEIYNSKNVRIYSLLPVTDVNAHCSLKQTQCYVYVPTILSAGTYHWRVRPWNTYGSGYGSWSAPTYFTLYTQPGQVTLKYPLTTSITQPPFQWTANPIATHYFVLVKQGNTQLVKSWYLAKTVNCSTGSGNCTLQSPVVLAHGVTYNWSVLTYNPYTQTPYGPWSAIASFKVP